MSIAQVILPEWDHEMTTTRALLERVPSDKGSWKPHPKSMAMGSLAIHLSNLPLWARETMARTELDLNPPSGPPFKSPEFTSAEDAVRRFDEHVAQAREGIAAASDDDMKVVWTLLNGGNKVLAMPRVACLRTFVMNHLIHHRGQLSVYLRLNDVPLPSIYGPTADM